jgi:flagellar hook-length control protein FliK
MLEIAVVKTTPQSAETPSHTGRKPVGSADRDENAQEFQKEYEAASQTEENAVESKQPDSDPEEGTSTPADSILDPSEKDETATSEEEFDRAPDNALLEERLDPPSVEAATVDGSVDTPETGPIPPRDDRPEKPGQAFATALAPDRLDDVPRGTDAVHDKAELQAQKTENKGKTTVEAIVLSKAAQHAESASRASGSSGIPGAGAVHANGPEVASQQAQIQKPAVDIVAQKPMKAARAEEKLLQRSESALPQRGDVNADQVKPPSPATWTPHVGMATSASVQALTKTEIGKEKIELFSVSPTDLDGLSAWESRSTSHQSSANALAQVLARGETPSMIARQMAEALQKLPDRPVEISLNPRELGRVRMNISAAETGITVTVVAERPETLDLMRRNIEQLAREFQSIGYESINFAFSEGETRQGFSEDQTEQSVHDTTRLELSPIEDDPVPDHPMIVTNGVDIRL